MYIKREELVDFKITRKDLIGDIYEYDGKMIRIIQNPYKQYVKQLMKNPLIVELIKKKFLVDTCISDDILEEDRDKLILEHRKINPPQAASQWTFEMMKDAAKLVLRMNLICLKYGYELKDCHQANILFDGTTPIWVDFGSIVKRDNRRKDWIARNEFLRRYYYPLKLWSGGYEKTIDALMRSAMNLELEELMGIYYRIPLVVARHILSLNIFLKRRPDAELKYYISRLDDIKYRSDSQWGDYQNSYWEGYNKRFEYEIEWINKTATINTMIEIGANQGVFSYRVAQQTGIEKIIATDYDKKAVDIMYRRIKREENASGKITPLLLDFVWIPLEQLKKYQSDLVVANALTHHLLLSQKMTMSAMLERLALLTNRYIIVEFMPYGVAKRKKDLPAWYTLDNFLESLRKIFIITNVYKAEERRIIITGVKKEDKCSV